MSLLPTDIVDRLRFAADDMDTHRYTLYEKAADEIEALRAEVERLRAACVEARWLLERAEQLAAKDAPQLADDIRGWRIPSPTSESRQDCVQCEGYGRVIGCVTGSKYDCENCNGTGSVIVRLPVNTPAA